MYKSHVTLRNRQWTSEREKYIGTCVQCCISTTHGVIPPATLPHSGPHPPITRPPRVVHSDTAGQPPKWTLAVNSKQNPDYMFPFKHALQLSPVSDRVGLGLKQDREDGATHQRRLLANRTCGCGDISFSKASPRSGRAGSGWAVHAVTWIWPLRHVRARLSFALACT